MMAIFMQKEKGIIVISTSSGIKTFIDVLYVHDIDQDVPNVGQLVENGLKISFENQFCLIFDTIGREIVRVNMKDKILMFDHIKEEKQITYFSEVSPNELWHKQLGHCHIQ